MRQAQPRVAMCDSWKNAGMDLGGPQAQGFSLRLGAGVWRSLLISPLPGRIMWPAPQPPALWLCVCLPTCGMRGGDQEFPNCPSGGARVYRGAPGQPCSSLLRSTPALT